MLLITGAVGTVGSQLVRILKDKGVPFRAGVHARIIRETGFAYLVVRAQVG
jgi:nucleoside-diphosphate-sugar epimerase